MIYTATHVTNTLAKINAALERKQYASAHQLRVLRKARRTWMKRLDAFINPKAPARPLPARNYQSTSNQLTLI